MFDAMGVEAFADRARAELRGTGEQARKPSQRPRRFTVDSGVNVFLRWSMRSGDDGVSR
jgi:hypothetical protein